MNSFSLWLEFEEHFGGYPTPEDDPQRDFCNVQIRIGTTVYAANVWAFGYIEVARGQDLAGAALVSPATWLLPPDLLVERLDRPTISAAVEELLAAGDLPETWLVEPKEDSPPGA